MTGTTLIRYSAGPWLGMIRNDCLVALPADSSEETAAIVWDLMAEAPGVERLLATILSGRLDLTGLPSFALVSFRQNSLHAILRGRVSLTVVGADGAEPILRGTGVATWNERIVPDITGLRFTVDEDEYQAETLPLLEGAVRLSAVEVDLPDVGHQPSAVASSEPVVESESVVESVEESEESDAPAQTPGPTTGPATQPIPTNTPSSRVDVTDDAAPEPEADETPEQEQAAPEETVASVEPGEPGEDLEQASAPRDEETIEAPVEDEPAPADEPTEEPEVDDSTVARVPSEAEPEPESTPEPEPEADDEHTIASPSAAAAAAATSSIPGPQELIDSVPWLAAARQASAPSGTTAEDADQAATQAPELVEMPRDLEATVNPDDADTVLSANVPGAVPADIAVPPVPPVAPQTGSEGLDLDDHDGHTVMRSDLGDLAAPEPAAPATPPAPPATGPMVLARNCAQGHANPPTATECGVCGQSLEGEAVQVRRPALGRMRMSTGEVIELDRPVVIGRQPQANRVGSGTMPRMIQVRSPHGDISRNHCEVVLEGWHVQLRDLKATNGTVLIREGRPPRRLGQGEEIMLLDGDIADLGDGISVRFEGLW